RSNSPEQVGKTAIYRGGFPAIFAGYLIRLTSSKDLHSEYLNEYMASPRARDYLKLIKSDGVYQSNISASKLKEMPIPLPNLAKQQEIAAHLLTYKKIFLQLMEDLKSLHNLLDLIKFIFLKRVYQKLLNSSLERYLNVFKN
ncbi:MAG: restriction endonuclease subunit S, partial [Deltaproteobacteria bacterium]|nr:restriction endonuclease subunit S [Deltaproteobacteria bacterium]